MVAQRCDRRRRARATRQRPGAPGGAWWPRRRCAGRPGRPRARARHVSGVTTERTRRFEARRRPGPRCGADPGRPRPWSRAAVAALAVDDHATMPAPADRSNPASCMAREHHRGADVVVGHVVTGVAEVDTETDLGRLVGDGVGAARGSAATGRGRARRGQCQSALRIQPVGSARRAPRDRGCR